MEVTNKTKILKILEANRGNTVSGSRLAKALDISRSAVWKIIEELRKEGYEINAVTNKGYSLSETTDLLSADGILLYLKNPNIKRHQIHVYKTLESTNQLAKKMAIEGSGHGTIVLSEEQTKGRGRLGRDFFSPREKGIYMSLLLQPSGTADEAVSITTAASVAVCRALSKLFGIEAQIKWVNDIFIDNRKVCGILTEAVCNFETGSIESIILGIGLNVTTEKDEFPQELREIAGSLAEYLQQKIGQESLLSIPPRNQLAASIIDEVFKISEQLKSDDYISEYRSRCFILGKEIVVSRGNIKFQAKALGIDSQGGLIIEKSDGNQEILNSGEITIRPQSTN